jgi:hypothetical protein
LVVSYGSLWMEFAKMFFSLLLQAKSVFLRSARDLAICGLTSPEFHETTTYEGFLKLLTRQCRYEWIMIDTKGFDLWAMNRFAELRHCINL